MSAFSLPLIPELPESQQNKKKQKKKNNVVKLRYIVMFQKAGLTPVTARSASQCL